MNWTIHVLLQLQGAEGRQVMKRRTSVAKLCEPASRRTKSSFCSLAHCPKLLCVR